MSAAMHKYTSKEQEVLEIFNRHVASFTAGDLDAVVQDFAEGAIVITPDGVFEGHEEIRAFYKRLLDEFGVIDRGDSSGIQIDMVHVRRDTLVISWHATSLSLVFHFGTDTFICRDDRIERQSIMFLPPKSRAPVAA